MQAYPIGTTDRAKGQLSHVNTMVSIEFILATSTLAVGSRSPKKKKEMLERVGSAVAGLMVRQPAGDEPRLGIGDRGCMQEEESLDSVPNWGVLSNLAPLIRNDTGKLLKAIEDV
ncbi:hypothetical protein MRX96_044353 [Rhipicephalus microplus]